MIDRNEYIDIFEKYNDPAICYLKDHATRFIKTNELVVSSISSNNKGNILDVASHWLHNALLYARDGFNVTCCDLVGREIGHESVKQLAKDNNIKLVTYDSLENPFELESLEENYFDIVMFTETIEHITFNPVKMWSIFYKLMKIGGKIVITTPNYFYKDGAFIKDLKQLLKFRSSGLVIDNLLDYHTYSHHWKEYSAKDIECYFNRLSPDFRIAELLYVDFSEGNKDNWKQNNSYFPNIFYPSLYIEIELFSKEHGILVEPHW